jgi:hypothetical protein
VFVGRLGELTLGEKMVGGREVGNFRPFRGIFGCVEGFPKEDVASRDLLAPLDEDCKSTHSGHKRLFFVLIYL